MRWPWRRRIFPQGTLDLLVLKVVALGPRHGYAIAQRLQQMSRKAVQVQQGTLYPALHRLENRGLLAADWRLSDTGRDAKFYRLTAKGRAHLGSRASELAAPDRGDRPDSRGGRRDVVSWLGRLLRRRRLESRARRRSCAITSSGRSRTTCGRG